MGILVVGEALVDVVHEPGGIAMRPGGSPTNVAVGLARLGHEVSALCYLGRDDHGERVRAHLRAAGVAERPEGIVAPATSVADVRLNAGGDARYEFSVGWDAPTTLDWTGVDVVHAGSIALALEPGAGHLAELLRSRPPGVRVTIDPNVRPAFLAPESAAGRIAPFLRMADVVKLSHEDAAHLYPGLLPDAVLDRLLELGSSIVAMTHGAEGATLATTSARVSVPAMATRVVDTVGAGDSFMAALISAIADADGWEPDGDLLREFGRFAARASAITVARRGADLPTRAELRRESVD